MGIFSSISNAIFGSDEDEKKPAGTTPTSTSPKPTATSGPKTQKLMSIEEVEDRDAAVCEAGCKARRERRDQLGREERVAAQIEEGVVA